MLTDSGAAGPTVIHRAYGYAAGLALSAAVAAFNFAGAFAQEFVSPEAATGRYRQTGGEAAKFMVAAANPIAAAAGIEILKAGGSAVDAAVAIQAVLTMVEPQSSGFGGGSFIVHWDAATKTVSTFDGRESAPAAAMERRFLTAEGAAMNRMEAVLGGHSVGTPGTLRALELAHSKHGKLKWSAVFDPALRVADNGFALSPRLHELLDGDRAMGRLEPARSFYLTADGAPKPVGTIVKNPEFAAVLRAVAEQGADAFYGGPIADDIVKAVTTSAENPGDLTLADLAGYRAVERPPVCAAYRERRLCGMAPPTSGGVGVLQTLTMLERFDLKALGPTSARAQHLMIEAGRLAMADRNTYIADPDILPVPTEGLLDSGYLASRAKLIGIDTRMPEAAPGTLPRKAARDWRMADSPERVSTSHFSVVDAAGNAVAMTTSIEGSFGSRVMVRGFLLNNTLTDFSYADVADGKRVANAVGPKKRPRSSMAPTLVFDRDGRLEMVVGSPGGPAIVGFVVQTLVAMIDWDMTPQQAISGPHVVVFGRGVTVEPELAALKPELEALGHQVRVGEFPSGIHAIRIMNGRLFGGADPRREGAVIGE